MNKTIFITGATAGFRASSVQKPARNIAGFIETYRSSNGDIAK